MLALEARAFDKAALQGRLCTLTTIGGVGARCAAHGAGHRSEAMVQLLEAARRLQHREAHRGDARAASGLVERLAADRQLSVASVLRQLGDVEVWRGRHLHRRRPGTTRRSAEGVALSGEVDELAQGESDSDLHRRVRGRVLDASELAAYACVPEIAVIDRLAVDHEHGPTPLADL